MDELELPDIRGAIESHRKIIVRNVTKNTEFEVKEVLSDRQRQIVLAGGLLDYTREQNGKN
jgi:aconitate hydratase